MGRLFPNSSLLCMVFGSLDLPLSSLLSLLLLPILHLPYFGFGRRHALNRQRQRQPHRIRGQHIEMFPYVLGAGADILHELDVALDLLGRWRVYPGRFSFLAADMRSATESVRSTG